MSTPPPSVPPKRRSSVKLHEYVLPRSISVAKEAFLPFSEHELNLKVEALLGVGDLAEWRKFTEQVNIILSERAEYNFRKFRREFSLEDTTQTRGEQQTTCLSDLCKFFREAEFSPLPNQYFESSLHSFYVFDLPLLFDWSEFDSSPLANCGEFGSEHAPYSKKLYIFTRGLRQDSQTGLFLESKLDFLVLRMFRSLVNRFPVLWKTLFAHLTIDTDGLPICAPHHPYTDDECARYQRDVLDLSPTQADGIQMRRETLASIMTRKGFWKTMFSKITVTEPVYRDVILMHCHDNTKKRLSDGAFLRNSERTAVDLVYYRDIPISDIDVLLPVKDIKLKPLHSVIFVLTLFTTIWLMYTAMTVEPDSNTGQIFFVIGLVIAITNQLYSLWFSLQNRKDYYFDLLRQWRQSKVVCAGVSVLSALTEEVKEQNNKEATLAYAFLWKYGPMSKRELDKKCEDFVQREFNHTIDFDVTGSVNLLQGIRLIRECKGADGSPQYEVSVTPSQYMEQYPVLTTLNTLLKKS